MPVQAVAASGATANLKSPRLAGDGWGETVGMAADGMVVDGARDEVTAGGAPVEVALAVALAVGSTAQPATRMASRTANGAEWRVGMRRRGRVSMSITGPSGCR